MNRVQLGIKLKDFRNEAGLTQDQLAERLIMDPKKISRIERGVQYAEDSYLFALSKISSLDLEEIQKDTLEAKNVDIRNSTADKLITVSNEDLLIELRKLQEVNHQILRTLNNLPHKIKFHY